MALHKNHIGKKVQRIRLYKGVTQEELAIQIGKTRSLISFFERTGKINKYTLSEIAEALKISVTEIEETTIENINPRDKSMFLKQNKFPSAKDLVTKLIEENEFLKSTVNKQLEIIAELSSKVIH